MMRELHLLLDKDSIGIKNLRPKKNNITISNTMLCVLFAYVFYLDISILHLKCRCIKQLR